MKKLIALIIVCLLICAGVYYYVALPAINIHSPGLWTFVISILAIIGIVLISLQRIPNTVKKGYGILFGAVIAVFAVGGILCKLS